MATLKLEDIANLAGVSRSTVSRVINQHPNVRPDVRARVLRVIQATSFRPNAAAQMLASQRSSIIGLVLPRSVSSFFTDPYFPHLTQGIAQASNEANYTLALFLANSKEDEEKIFAQVSQRRLLDGILVQSGQSADPLIERLVGSSIPLLIIGRPFHPEGVHYIDVDNVAAACKAVQHLIGLGRRRIATILGVADSTVTEDRKSGYLQALAQAGLPAEAALMAAGDFTEAGGSQAMQALLPAQPDAVFAASDTMAIGAMRAISAAGLRVPQDIAVVGFDDLPLAAAANPPLTTVRQAIYQFGFKAVELLSELIAQGPQPAHSTMMETELIIRQSCGAVPGAMPPPRRQQTEAD